ncbi:unnamed protein product [Linum trigynum]|uniref:Uncharacterized protein n=1 Tax=Linum trigynum TaxID=586398 RepID=A0AAV2ETV3_9ROSI
MTKKNKSSKSHSKKASPIKLNPCKALQDWSPVKERKSKSRTRMATLTLQEISAWTDAARATTDVKANQTPTSPMEDATCFPSIGMVEIRPNSA